jgi:uncharacterized delta-60 repeat protein
MTLAHRFFATLCAASIFPASAAGLVDREFGINGSSVAAFNLGGANDDSATAIDIASNGKIVLAGIARVDAAHRCFGVMRFLPDGRLDDGFSGNGKFSRPGLCANASIVINAMKVDDSNRIVFAGSYQADTAHRQFMLGRIKADGSGLDATFGGTPIAGLATQDFGGSNNSVAKGLVLQSDGKIVAVGSAQGEFIDSLTSFAMARFTTAGAPDTSFSGNGRLLYGWGSSSADNVYHEANAAIVQGDGKIVVAGYSTQSATDADFAVLRLNANGTFDTSYGPNGSGARLVDFGGSCSVDGAYAIADRTYFGSPAGNGVVLAGTHCVSDENYDFAVAVLDADGKLDTNFNGTGKSVINIDLGSANYDVATSVQLEAVDSIAFIPNRITLAGVALNTNAGSPGFDFAMTRLSMNGSIDATFGTNGRYSFGFDLGGSNDDVANAMVIRGREAFIAGSTQRATTNDTDFVVARVLVNDTIFSSEFEQH